MAFTAIVLVLGQVLQLGIIAMLVAAAVRMHAAGRGVESAGVRRFFQYLLLLILVGLTAVGLSLLLGQALGGDATDRPTALAFTFVGLPLLALLAWWLVRSHRRDEDESRSEWFVIYLTLTALSALLVACFTAVSAASALAAGSGIDGDSVAFALVWAIVWAAHWHIAARLPEPGRNTPHLLLGSIAGLTLAVAGMVITLGEALRLIVLPPMWLPSTAPLASGLALLLVGTAAWVRYWATAAARLGRGPLWLAFVLLAGTGGGLLLALVGASLTLWRVLVWFIGNPGGLGPRDHFAPIFTAAACLVAGALVWWYHHTLLAERGRVRDGVVRVYEYVLSGIGLGAAAAGVGFVVAALARAAAPLLLGESRAINVLLVGITLLAVGTPTWARFWRRITRGRADDPAAELGSLTRRIYLVAVLGVPSVVAIVALVAVAVRFFQDLTATGVGPGTLAGLSGSLGWLAGALVVLAFHVAVFRQDRAVRPPTAPAPGATEVTPAPAPAAVPASITLVGRSDPALAESLGGATGAQVESWARLDVEAPAWDGAEVARAVAGFGGRDVLVLAEPDGMRVVPVTRPGRPGPA